MADILIRGISMPPKGKSICIEIFGAGGVHRFGECYPCALAYDVKTPHGRLIDAEAYMDYMQNRYDNNEITNGDWIDFRLSLKDQLTIVPAEGGTDECSEN